MFLTPHTHVGVLRGGSTSVYDHSILSGGTVLRELSTYEPIDIFISPDGLWHMHGRNKSPERILKNVDVVFNALYGAYGQNGKVQDILTRHGTRFTGSHAFPSSVANNIYLTKRIAHEEGIRTPLSVYVKDTDDLSEYVPSIVHTIPFPMLVKPASGGTSFGVYHVRDEAELYIALESLLTVHDAVLVEEYISGREFSCVVLDAFRDAPVYTCSPVESLYTHTEGKWTHGGRDGRNRFVTHPVLQTEHREDMQRIARHMHTRLGLRDYSQSDFIVHPKRGVYLVHIKSQPHMGEESVLKHSLDTLGISFKHFVDHTLSLALRRK